MSKVLYQMADYFGLSPQEATQLVYSASHRYKVFKIKKREKGKTRTIAQPAREVKAVQRWLVEQLQSELPIHDAATAYRKGRGIRLNAQRHVQNRYLLKMDFKNYFPSIKRDDLKKHFAKYLPEHFDDDDYECICLITLWRPSKNAELELCIGGPSSPLISNTIAYDFDVLVHNHCAEMGVTYTRYADDLAFSTNQPEILRQIEDFIVETCKRLEYPALRVNQKKTVHVSSKHRRFITGVTLSSEGKLSIGRERKRTIRAALYRAKNNQLDQKSMAQLRGNLAFAKDIDPDFVSAMCKKYGVAHIQSVLRWEPD